MASQKATNYLCEALKGNYAWGSEDRLSQVFAASFNHSPAFRRLFYRFAGLRPLRHPEARTQMCESDGVHDGRLDICLYDGRRLRVIIENKIEAPLYANQLGRYSHIHPGKTVSKVALVKHFFEPFADLKGWRILHWGDLYRRALGNIHGHSGSDDGFVIDNLASYMEETGLNTVTCITRAELFSLAKAVYKLRRPKGFWFSLKTPAFDIASRYLQMLEGIVDMTKAEPLIRKAVKKNYRFNPSFCGWVESDDQDRHHFMMGASVSLQRRNRKAREVGTAILFYDDSPKRYRIVSYWQDKDSRSFQNETEYRGKDLDFDRYAKQVISLWKRWLRR